MERIGLIAGYGELPMIFSKKARANGDVVIAFALKGVTREDLAKHVDKIHWLEWGDLKKGLLLLVTERIKKIIMLGKIEKSLVLKGDKKLDDVSKKIFENIGRDKKDYSIFNEAAKVFNSLGVKILDSTTYLKELIPQKGTLTKKGLSDDEQRDVDYGKEVTKELSRLDIGQTVAVKNRTVIAVEGIEGTDETIKRAGLLTGGDFVVVKVSRPDQDMRFDVPVVGTDTVKALIEAKGQVLALEAGRMLLVDKAEAVKLADDNGISLVVV
ncbi:MAG: UDP-2,3-diacylglucosamine diphosphatase LpxI [Candidatus Omnitrophica bacterium]|nr:UDP-2,3-diacylglucosamine diphosphatase LpxI [Candidatus Omnitrophota bacterium]